VNLPKPHAARELRRIQFIERARQMKKLLIILGSLFAAGVAIAGVLYVSFPVPMTTYGGMGLNFLKSLSAPAGTLAFETNSAYKAPVAAAASPPFADAAWPNAAAGDWPSYNRTPTSQRFSPLDQINTKNVAKLKVLCTYDLGEFTAFESGLIMVNSALIGTAEFEIFSINAATCAENWRTRLDYPGALLPANRGAAYMDGMLFRGTQDCRVLAFDFKTGKQVWETTICEAKRGESVPSAPIASDGLVFVGNAGGDYKGGKGKVYALTERPARSSGSSFSSPKSRATSSGARWASRRSTRRHGTTRQVYPSAAAGRGPRTRSISRTVCCTSREAIQPPTSPQGHAKASISRPTRSS
jgi:alcohol dehydrogenase (cytochrome c)